MINDAYENSLTFYGCCCIKQYNPNPNAEYSLFDLFYDGMIIDTIEKPNRIQAVQEFHSKLLKGIYNSIFVPSQSNCEVK